MDSTTIKLETLEVLVTDEITHNSAGTDLTVSNLHSSGTNCEDAISLKLEVPLNSVDLSINYEVHGERDLIEPSSRTISEFIVIAPQEDNFCNYEGFPEDGRPYSPVPKEEIKVDTSIPAVKQDTSIPAVKQGTSIPPVKQDTSIPAVKQGIMDIVIKKEETYILKEEINGYQTAEGDIQVFQEHIKLENDMNCTSVDNLNKTVKTEKQPVVLMNELTEDGIKEDFVKSERIDGDSSLSDDHISKIHPGAVRITASEEGRDVDQPISLKSDCGKSFSQLGDLKRHQLLHIGERPFSCEICGKFFALCYNLHNLMKKHQEVKPYPCPDCDKAFNEMRSLKNHSLTHTGERPYPCTLCDKTFRDPYNLKVHQRTHTGEKPYGCTMCDKSFIDQSHLKRHQRIHTGEKPYGCAICNKSFTASNALTVHQRTHTGEKPYGCTMCDKHFSSQTALRVH